MGTEVLSCGFQYIWKKPSEKLITFLQALTRFLSGKVILKVVNLYFSFVSGYC
jgi:hypothetical protein